MSYAVVLPITDLEHVMREIKHQHLAEEAIRRQRHKECQWQNEYRKLKKERSNETTK